MPDSKLTQLRQEVDHLRPTDQFFHLVCNWPYPFDDTDKKTELWPRCTIQDILGTGNIP